MRAWFDLSAGYGYTLEVNRRLPVLAAIEPFRNAPEAVGDAADLGSPAVSSIDRLVRSALADEPGAMRRLLIAVAPSVRHTCRGVLGPKHPDLEDTVQECLISVVRSLPAFRFEADFSRYVAKISLRVAISARQRRRSEAHVIAQLGDLQQVRADPVTGEVGDARDSEKTEILRGLIHQLAPEQRQALLLHCVLEYSLEETAEIAEVKVNTAKTRIRLAKNRLRQRIAEDPRASVVLERLPR